MPDRRPLLSARIPEIIAAMTETWPELTPNMAEIVINAGFLPLAGRYDPSRDIYSCMEHAYAIRGNGVEALFATMDMHGRAPSSRRMYLSAAFRACLCGICTGICGNCGYPGNRLEGFPPCSCVIREREEYERSRPWYSINSTEESLSSARKLVRKASPRGTGTRKKPKYRPHARRCSDHGLLELIDEIGLLPVQITIGTEECVRATIGTSLVFDSECPVPFRTVRGASPDDAASCGIILPHRHLVVNSARQEVVQWIRSVRRT